MHCKDDRTGSEDLAMSLNGIDVDPEATSLAKLITLSPPGSSGPVVAIDLDGAATAKMPNSK